MEETSDSLKEAVRSENPDLSQPGSEAELYPQELLAAIKASQESDERHRVIAETASDALITIDENSTILVLNQAAERIFGYAIEEMVGKQLTMLMPQYFRQLHEAGIKRYIATGQKHLSWAGVEMPGLHKSGREIPLEVSFGEYQKDGKRYFTGILRDVSKRKRGEEGRLLLAAIVDSSDDAILSKTLDGWVTSWNAGAEKMYGYTAEEAIGQHVSFIIPPDRQQELPRILENLRLGGRVEHLETKRLRKDGRLIDVSVSISPVMDSSAEVIGAATIARDITERKRSEESLRFLAEAAGMLASSLDYQTTLANVAHLAVPRLSDWCVVHIVKEDGSLQQVASAHADEAKLERLRELNRKYPSGFLSAHSYSLVIKTGQSQLIPQITDSILKEVSHDVKHLELLRSLGMKSSMCVPLTARGRTYGAITFTNGESDRVFDSSSLAFAESVAHLAATAVDNATLFKEMQAANRSKEEFLATLSHELRTPLTPIIGWVHMIRSGILKADDLQHGLAVVEGNSQTLTRLINDLLDMSAIMSGKMRIEKLPVSLDEAVGEAVETVRPMAEKRSVNILVKLCKDDQVVINGDRTRLVQVFWNLLSNAIKFSDEGSQVRVICEADKEEARFKVEDDGIGIAPGFLPDVFERFRQADSSVTRTHGGLGIGLALAKSFVEAHGGSVSVSSPGLGSGSRFTVNLPRLALPVDSKASHVSRVEGGRAESKLNVLVVEDALDTLEMLDKTLRIYGYQVTPCDSGAQAIKASESTPFDVIISDIGMPEMDGYELIRRLRKLPHLSGVPAIALTGYAAEDDIKAALAAGFDLHMDKPVDPTELMVQIRELLQSKRSTTA